MISSQTKAQAASAASCDRNDVRSDGNGLSKKRKRQSPFRIKVGCVVALRYRPASGNHVTMIMPPPHAEKGDGRAQPKTTKPTKRPLLSLLGVESHAEVWTDPIPGRDEGLALIGRRVRCCFVRPEKEVSPEVTPNKNNDVSKKQVTAKMRTYIVEGEVVSVLNYGSKQWQQEQQRARRKRTDRAGFTVELLIDRDVLAKAPFLQRSDQDVDITKLKKESAKRTQRNEEAIRGKNKITVKVTLADPSGIVPRRDQGLGGQNNVNSRKDDKNRNSNGDIAKWAIRKRITNTPGEFLQGQQQVNPKKRKRDDGASESVSATTTNPGEGTLVSGEKAKKSGSNNAAKSGDLDGKKQLQVDRNEDKVVRNGDASTKEKTTETEGASSNTKDTAKNGKSKKDASGDENPSAKKKKKSNGSKKAAANVPTLFMGNGNDEAAQQQRNWRWFAARYHDMYLSTGSYTRTTSIYNHNFDIFDYYSEVLSVIGGLTGEVLDVTPSSKPNTLAMVTIRRLILPEHTASGRIALHNQQGGALEIFDDYDSSLFGSRSSTNEAARSENGLNANGGIPSVVFRVPIEELVIVSHRVTRHSQKNMQLSLVEHGSESGVNELRIGSSYSLRADCRVPLDIMAPTNGHITSCIQPTNGSGNGDFRTCHRCRKLLPNSKMTKCGNHLCASRRSMLQSSGEHDVPEPEMSWCKPCLHFLISAVAVISSGTDEENKLPCCNTYCDCRHCQTTLHMDRHDDFLLKAVQNAVFATVQAEDTKENSATNEEQYNPFSETISVVKSMPQCAFDIPRGLTELDDLPLSSGKPITRIKMPGKRGRKQYTQIGRRSPTAEKRKTDSASKQSTNKSKLGSRMSPAKGDSSKPPARRISEDYTVFKPSCSRLMSCKEIVATKKVRGDNGESEESPLSGDKPRNLRELQNSSLLTAEKDEKTTSSRRMRASQRRLMKDVSALGAIGLNLDTLAGREQQLRFDRSSIHAWGVFADEEITAGDMVVEYRGELIGNAMAEKREREYELAKIGSDYMFRIDNLTVCDATKQGNVARFINASCDPNCYTKIITSDGRQRIVIYSKKDIKAGDELCYDYKFPLEYDVSKRIPCHCGARECRGFMNWDKRYVALPGTSQTGKDASVQEAIKQPSET